MMKNLLIISRNVIYKNLENTMKADVIELDTKQKIQKFLCIIQINKLMLKYKIKWD